MTVRKQKRGKETKLYEDLDMIMKKRIDKKDFFNSIFACAVLVIFELLFFRTALRNKLLLFSDAGDGRFNNLLCEHWFQVLSGKAHINELPTFYPISSTLGYSDAMLVGGGYIPFSGYWDLICILQIK